MADVIRAELLEIIKRIELPYAEPAFGSKENHLNIKKALLSGYFMQVSRARLPWQAVWVHTHGKASQHSLLVMVLLTSNFLSNPKKMLLTTWCLSLSSQARILYVHLTHHSSSFLFTGDLRAQQANLPLPQLLLSSP